jgi:hypothetical protein
MMARIILIAILSDRTRTSPGTAGEAHQNRADHAAPAFGPLFSEREF